MQFVNRVEAGQKLAKSLQKFAREDGVVLALPRGGIVLGAVVAQKLHCRLGVILVHKISNPINPEYATGAIVEGEDPVLNKDDLSAAGEPWFASATNDARKINEKRHKLYYGAKNLPNVKNKLAILVDDGIATGVTMEAAVRAILKSGAKKVVVAVPVAPMDSIELLKSLGAEVIVLDNPEEFLGAVGAHYQEFNQVEDEEVVRLLQEAADKYNSAKNRGKQ